MRYLLAAALALAALGCEHFEAPERTLPARIQSIHIPMPRNESFEYGLEEPLALALHEEFLADGRLRIVRSAEADARLAVTITDFGAMVRAVNSDDYPLFDTAEIEALVVLTEPVREEPTVRSDAFASYNYMSDPRRSEFVPDPVWRRELIQALAQNIVYQVIDGYRVPSDYPDSEGAIDLDSMEDRRVPSVGGSSLTPR